MTVMPYFLADFVPFRFRHREVDLWYRALAGCKRLPILIEAGDKGFALLLFHAEIIETRGSEHPLTLAPNAVFGCLRLRRIALLAMTSGAALTTRDEWQRNQTNVHTYLVVSNPISIA
jgi:hypothetical protein